MVSLPNVPVVCLHSYLNVKAGVGCSETSQKADEAEQSAILKYKLKAPQI